jgi:hypothetical protein
MIDKNVQVGDVVLVSYNDANDGPVYIVTITTVDEIGIWGAYELLCLGLKLTPPPGDRPGGGLWRWDNIGLLTKLTK